MVDRSTRPVILWFRRDLRLGDNPALNAAVASGRPILPLYILDQIGERRRLGAASRWWLDKSLRALDVSLQARGGQLILRRGDAEAEVRRLIAETGADRVFMNRLFEPEAVARDADIAHGLKAEGIECRGFNATLLCRPGAVLNEAGQPYKVFTPFLRALLAIAEAPGALDAPEGLAFPDPVASEVVEAWGLHPTRPDWSSGFVGTPGEAGAKAALDAFVTSGLKTYATDRDRPDRGGTSGLGAHLHWGEIGPWRVVETARAAAAHGEVSAAEAEKFVTEIGWREFSAHLLHHYPYLPERAFKPEYDAMPWRDDPEALAAWKAGRTGYPLVDAGMRQLWATGTMHNRVRMVVASFLIKHLLIDWREGEACFYDRLTDADLASNVQNWQWVAGSGADAAPYFRIFNPVLQGEKFDPHGGYVRRWVPEIARLADRWIQAPWMAPPAALAEAGVRLGVTYPQPIVDHATARERALGALKMIAASFHSEGGQ